MGNDKQNSKNYLFVHLLHSHHETKDYNNTNNKQHHKGKPHNRLKQHHERNAPQTSQHINATQPHIFQLQTAIPSFPFTCQQHNITINCIHFKYNIQFHITLSTMQIFNIMLNLTNNPIFTRALAAYLWSWSWCTRWRSLGCATDGTTKDFTLLKLFRKVLSTISGELS